MYLLLLHRISGILISLKISIDLQYGANIIYNMINDDIISFLQDSIF